MSRKRSVDFSGISLINASLIRNVISKWIYRNKITHLEIARRAIGKWRTAINSISNAISSENSEISIQLLKSMRGNRSSEEILYLRGLLLDSHKTFTTFHNMKDTELEKLCEDVDFHHNLGRSILFLQGDVGSCTYIVARGRVDLYFERTKERERDILRELGDCRGKRISDSLCSSLGILLKSLPAGSVFGELALLSEKNSARSCSAVASPGSLILIVYPITYNTLLRKYRLSEEQINLATLLLRELPFFSHYGYGRLTNIAYSMRPRKFSSKKVIAQSGEKVNVLFLIISGEVKVYPAGCHYSCKMSVRVPRLAVANYGRGMMIGEREVHKRQHTFQMSYVASTETEVFEMDYTLYEDSACSQKHRTSDFFKAAERVEIVRDKMHERRFNVSDKFLEEHFRQKPDHKPDHKSTLVDCPPLLTSPNILRQSPPVSPNILHHSFNPSTSPLAYFRNEDHNKSILPKKNPAVASSAALLSQSKRLSLPPNPSINNYIFSDKSNPKYPANKASGPFGSTQRLLTVGVEPMTMSSDEKTRTLTRPKTSSGLTLRQDQSAQLMATMLQVEDSQQQLHRLRLRPQTAGPHRTFMPVTAPSNIPGNTVPGEGVNAKRGSRKSFQKSSSMALLNLSSNSKSKPKRGMLSNPAV